EAPILFVGFNEFRIFAGENGGGSFFHTIVTQIKQAEPNLKAEFVTQIGKEPESFGRELMLLALEKPAEEVLSFLGLHLDAIKQLPEWRQREFGALVNELKEGQSTFTESALSADASTLIEFLGGL